MLSWRYQRLFAYPNVLNDEELAASQEAIDRYISTPDHELPEVFSRSEDGKAYANGFAFDKALEILTTHPGYWPIVVEFTHGRPAFTMSTLLVGSQQVKPLHLHCSREDFRWQSTRYDTREGRIFCDDFAILVYFDDVFPGDGGLLVVPGSHKQLLHGRLAYSTADLRPIGRICHLE